MNSYWVQQPQFQGQPQFQYQQPQFQQQPQFLQQPQFQLQIAPQSSTQEPQFAVPNYQQQKFEPKAVFHRSSRGQQVNKGSRKRRNNNSEIVRLKSKMKMMQTQLNTQPDNTVASLDLTPSAPPEEFIAPPTKLEEPVTMPEEKSKAISK